MAMPSAVATAMNATSSNRSMGSGGEELVKNKKAKPATSFTETVLCPKHLTVLGVGSRGKYKLSASIPVYSQEQE